MSGAIADKDCSQVMKGINELDLCKTGDDKQRMRLQEERLAVTSGRGRTCMVYEGAEFGRFLAVHLPRARQGPGSKTRSFSSSANRVTRSRVSDHDEIVVVLRCSGEWIVGVVFVRSLESIEACFASSASSDTKATKA